MAIIWVIILGAKVIKKTLNMPIVFLLKNIQINHEEIKRLGEEKPTIQEILKNEL